MKKLKRTKKNYHFMEVNESAAKHFIINLTNAASIQLLNLWFVKVKKKKTLWSESASELYRATATCRRSDCQLLRIEDATWSA
jgi:hypothetical protein